MTVRTLTNRCALLFSGVLLACVLIAVSAVVLFAPGCSPPTASPSGLVPPPPPPDPITAGPYYTRNAYGDSQAAASKVDLYAWIALGSGGTGTIDGMSPTITATGDYGRAWTTRSVPTQPCLAERLASMNADGWVFHLPRGRMAGRHYDLAQLVEARPGLELCTVQSFTDGVAELRADVEARQIAAGRTPTLTTVVVYTGYVGAIPEWWAPASNTDSIAAKVGEATRWGLVLQSKLDGVRVIHLMDAIGNDHPGTLSWVYWPSYLEQWGLGGGDEPWPGFSNPKLDLPDWLHCADQAQIKKWDPTINPPAASWAAKVDRVDWLLPYVIGSADDTRPAIVRAADAGERFGIVAAEPHSGVTKAQLSVTVARRTAARR